MLALPGMKPHNLANRFRQARMRRFVEIVEPLLSRPVRILDVGGTAAYWRALPHLYGMPNVEITIVNLGGAETNESNLRIRRGDGCALDFPDNSFDIVHSNSVIEHVGGWRDMQRMAGEVRRLAPRYFVQTPNYWFPFEPHFRLPFVQYLPRALHDRMRARVWPGVSIELLSARQLQALFPDATIERERFAGLAKSLIAVRPGSAPEVDDDNPPETSLAPGKPD